MKTFAFAIVASVCLAGIAFAADPPAPAAAPAAKKIEWEKMSVAEKKKYMKTTVLPTMKKLFVEVDPKRYKAMNCATCHGKKHDEVKFKMPSAELPKLPAPTDQPGFMALQQKKPEVVKFMGTKVKPTMASLLGKEEWAPNKPEGFGCYGCHTHEGAAAKPAETPAATKTAAVAPPAAPGKPAAPGQPAAPAAPAAAGW
jgi:cytochrome c553